MNDITTDTRDNRALSLIGFILFLVGIFLPFVFWPFLPVALPLAIIAELLALVFGLMSWRLKLGKVAAIGAVVYWLLAIVNTIRFFLLAGHH